MDATFADIGQGRRVDTHTDAFPRQARLVPRKIYDGHKNTRRLANLMPWTWLPREVPEHQNMMSKMSAGKQLRTWATEGDRRVDSRGTMAGHCGNFGQLWPTLVNLTACMHVGIVFSSLFSILLICGRPKQSTETHH